MAGIIQTDEEFKIEYMNQAAMALCGYRLEQVKGSTPAKFIPDFDTDMLQRELSRTESSDECITIELWGRHKNGNKFLCKMNISTLRNETGGNRGYMVSTEDITERREMEQALLESERKYHQIFETNQATKLIIRPKDGAIIEANTAACEFYAYSKDEILRLNISDINTLPPDNIAVQMQRSISEECTHFQFRHRLASGEIRDVEVYTGPVLIKGETLLYSIVHDITGRIQASRKIVHQQSQLTEAQRIAHLGSWEWVIDSNHLAWSDETYRIFGLQPQSREMTYEASLAMIHPDDLPLIKQFVESVQTGSFDLPTPHQIEHKIIRPDGTERLVLERIKINRDKNGRLVSIFGTIQDVTEARMAAEALRISEQRLQAIIDNSATVIYLKDNDGRYILINKLYEDLFHITKQQIIGNTDYDLFPQTTADLVAENDQQVITTGKTVQVEENVPQDDGVHTYISIKFPMFNAKGNVYGVCGISTDITDRKKMEEALRESEQRFQALSDASFEAIFISEKGICLDQNLAAERMFGYSRQEAVGRPNTDWIAPRDREIVKNNIQSNYQSPYEVSALTKDGRTFPAEIHGRTIWSKERHLRVTALRDITQRKAAERELRRSEQRFRYLIEGSIQGILIHRELKPLFFNKSYAQIHGYTPEEIYGMDSILPLISPRDQAVLIEYKNARLHGDTAPTRYEYQGVRKDGTLVWLENRVMVIQWDEEPAIQATIVDISNRKKAEEALKASEARYRMIFEGATEGIFAVDTSSMQFTYANPAITAMSGYSKEELLKLHLVEFHPKEDLTRIKKLMDDVIKGEIDRIKSLRCRRKDGSIFYADISVTRQILDDRYQLIAFFTEVTERIHLEEREHLRQRVLELVVTGAPLSEVLDFITKSIEDLSLGCICSILLLDEKGKHLRHGSAPSLPGFFTEAIDGLEFGTGSNGRTIFSKTRAMTEDILTHPQWLEFREPALRAGLRSCWSEPILSETGRVLGIFCIYYRTPGLPKESEIHLIEIAAEITGIAIRRKMVEDQLIRSMEEAQAANKAKSEFLANMSHELRTPLNGVLGILQLLQSTPLDEEQCQYVHTGISSGQNLLRLLSDILDLSKIEAGRMELESKNFHLGELLRSVQDIFFHQIKAKGINLHYGIADSVPLNLQGDRRRLRQILFNLVGNAVKFTKKGEIRVFVRRGQEIGGKIWLVFAVQDTGIGIPEDQLDNIFNKFTQLDGSYTRMFDGVGLGLNIVTRLLDMMGGSIAVKSEVGKGTTMQFEVPLEKVDRLSGTKETPVMWQPGERGPQSLHVLLAEDNPVNRVLATKLLEKNGFKVTAVEDGRQVIECLEKDVFDIILMDIQMPVMDGVEATKRIRNDKTGRFDTNIPIVALTAHAMKGDRESFLKSGMNDYIAKPIDSQELISVVSILTRPSG